MGSIGELLIGIAFAATAAQSTTPYAIPFALGQDIEPAEQAAITEEAENTIPDSHDFVSLAALDTSLPISVRREIVSNYYADEPLLARIAFCESSYRHHDESGDVLRGKVNSSDVGVMQINEWYHKADAEKLGYDIYDVRGNMAYARYLFEKQGSKPWSSSQACWGES